jgi:hypothetical protein
MNKSYYQKHKKECNKKSKIYNKKHKEEIKAWFKKFNHDRYPEIKKIQKEILFNLKINGCAICGYDKCPYALDFHHVNPRTKKFNITRQQMTSKSDKKLKEELNKCILLCSNCHDEVEWGD